MKLENPNLSKLVRHLSDLSELYLDGVNISTLSDDGSRSIPYSLPKLRVLSLSDCQISGPIHSSFASLDQLVHLDFSHNNLIGHIPSFQNSKSLTYLDLSHNKLSGTIPSSLFSLPSLKDLQLSNNLFRGSLSNFSTNPLSQLLSLDLSSNFLEGSIPMSLFRFKSLVLLNLSNNKLNGQIQLQHFGRLVDLTLLDLSYNNLSIETSLINYPLPQFTELKLASCKLKNIPNLRHQLKLRTLDLSDNQITGEIPNWIWSMENATLGYLNLSRNMLVNLQKPYAIPSSLFALDLHSNHLTGEIPIPTDNIEYMDYSSNYFSSGIPPDIGKNITYALFFSVSNNNLTGNIPESICNPIFLRVLDLSSNDFSGTIPSCLLRGRKSLAVLSLGNNSLTGNISNSFGSYCGLRTLDLNANHLEGSTPNSLANCTALEVLNLGNNKINDSFPCFMKNSPNLHVLVLRHNMFYGDIVCPGSRSHWPKIQIIDIASNYFTGNVPQNWFLNWSGMTNENADTQANVNHLSYEVSNLYHLYYQDTVTVTIKGLEVELVKILTIFNTIDISNNMFEGNIPDAVGKLKLLNLLNVSYNALTGSIPTELGNLKQLEALDLSSNKITGRIPVELTSLTFLSFLNLSDNQLAGRIPIGSQFQTFTAASFQGNKELCGVQLNITCPEDQLKPTPTPDDDETGSDNKIKWEWITLEVGFAVGLGTVVLPLVFCTRWKSCYYKHVDRVLLRLFKFQLHDRTSRRAAIVWRKHM